ncbi:hypothetical protein HDV04_006206 [Boothiomyces sp. JEL0838]|nr:hypothetical protein HDV04_006206 [Boothiomyces sp. JEL0838]
MSDRLISSYLVPVVIILGFSLQKNFQSIHILFYHAKFKSQFTLIGGVCIMLNFLILLSLTIVQDYTVSPYNLSVKALAVYNFFAGFCYHIVHAVLFYLIMIRMEVVFTKKNVLYKIYKGACLLGMLLKAVNIVLGIILNAGVINGTFASQIQSPWAKPQSIAAIIAAFYETVTMISASYIFISSIASKLGVPSIKLAKELVMKYAACDYIIMGGLKIYGCVGYVAAIRNNYVPDNIFLSGNGSLR